MPNDNTQVETVEVYTTKYALTKGILKERAELDPRYPGMATITRPGNYKIYYHGEGKDWHRAWPAALQRAEEMRKARIATMQRTIAKLERKVFTEPTVPLA